jgi:hypothetical protein
VLQCGLEGCNKFVGKNSSMDAALRKLKTHWLIDHSETSIKNFCYSNIGVEHDEGVVPIVKDDIMEEMDIKDESIDSHFEMAVTDISQFKGPFLCTHHGCDFSCLQVTRLGMHWNHKHLYDPSQASFVDQDSFTKITLFQVFRYIAQCSLCRLVRCARDTLQHAVEGIIKHISNCHPDDARERELTDMYVILQDEYGRVRHPESDDQESQVALSLLVTFLTFDI